MRLANLKSCLAALMLIILAAHGCSGTPDFVSEVSVEDKIARLRLGESDKSEVESIFGTDRGNDRNRWSYHFADKQFEISERRQGPGLGALPVAAGTVPTNTRAVVTVSFSEAGVVKAIEAARFFEEPFVNDYWFLVKESAKDPLESIAGVAEANGFKVSGLDKGAGTFSLEDPTSKARIAVKLDGRTLRITSRNPHHRLAKEYRAYTKRESALTNGITAADLVQ
jgi:hypothetical protein